MREEDKNRLRWQAMRRGLLELDLVLERFLEREFGCLDDAALGDFAALLKLEDTDLWALVSGAREAAGLTEGQRALLERLRHC